MKVLPNPALIAALTALSLSACNKHVEEVEHEHHKIVATNPQVQSITLTQKYVCQIHSRRHINVRALEMGYLEEIPVKEGQSVNEGDVLFTVLPNIYKARREAEFAERDLAQLEFNYTKKLYEDKVVSVNEVNLHQAKLSKARAKADLANAEFEFTKVKAPFSGIIDRQYQQRGSLVQEGEVLTTMSDNSVMWVYFYVPEARYLEYKADQEQDTDDHGAADAVDAVDGEGKAKPKVMDLQIELVLANGKKFEHPGKIGAIEADFNNQTGNIAFRADFPNPERLLRHGQTGTVLIHRVLRDAVIIPQRATFDVLDKRYVYVVDKDDVAHQREIAIQNELDDVFVVSKGLGGDDRIILEGVRQVRDGDVVECEEREPEDVVAKLKYHAE